MMYSFEEFRFMLHDVNTSYAYKHNLAKNAFIQHTVMHDINYLYNTHKFEFSKHAIRKRTLYAYIKSKHQHILKQHTANYDTDTRIHIPEQQRVQPVSILTNQLLDSHYVVQ